MLYEVSRLIGWQRLPWELKQAPAREFYRWLELMQIESECGVTNARK
jgi:hypothetical protein